MNIIATLNSLRQAFEQFQQAIPTYVESRQKTPVNAIISINGGGTAFEYDLQTLVGADHAKYDLANPTVSLRVKDTDGISPTFNMYINAEAVATYGIRAGRYLAIVNHYGNNSDSLEFQVKVQVQRK